jgi:hypothetical protein
MRFSFYPKVIASVSDFEHAVAQMPDAVMRETSVLVLRADIALWRSIQSASEATRADLRLQYGLVRRRTSSLFLALVPDLSFMSDGRRVAGDLENLSPSMLFSDEENLERKLSDEELSGLREADLARLVDEARARCVIHSSQNHHFLLPSGAHASQFVRIAEAMVSMVAVDTVAYWISLAIGVELFLGEVVGVYSLLSYPRLDASARDAINLLEDLGERYDRVVVVISISSTGGLARLVERWVAEGKVRPKLVSVFAVYAIGAYGATSFCRLELAGFESYRSQSECEICDKTGSTLVPIDEGTYTLTSRKVKDVALTTKYFSDQRSFLERFGSKPGVLRVHFDDPNERQPRHHAFYISVDALLDIPEFVEELRERVAKIEPRPSLILSPEHAVAARIGRLASDVLGAPYFSVDGPLGALEENVKGALSSCESLLVVDDVMISGARLRSINASLREAPDLCRSLKSVHFFTPMATPFSPREHAEIVKGLTHRHAWSASVSNLHSVFLPPWHATQDCPWCSEAKIYSDVLPDDEMLESEFDARLRVLSRRRSGIGSDCLDGGAWQLPSFGDQSPVLPVGSTPIQLVFACASAVQQLRVASEAPLDPKGFPVASVLAVRNFSKNYDEKLLWLPLLRAIRPEEVGEELAEFLFRFATTELIGGLEFMRRELAVAMLSGKMGRISDEKPLREFFVSAGFNYSAIADARYVSSAVRSADVGFRERRRRWRWWRSLVRAVKRRLRLRAEV